MSVVQAEARRHAAQLKRDVDAAKKQQAALVKAQRLAVQQLHANRITTTVSTPHTHWGNICQSNQSIKNIIFF